MKFQDKSKSLNIPRYKRTYWIFYAVAGILVAVLSVILWSYQVLVCYRKSIVGFGIASALLLKSPEIQTTVTDSLGTCTTITAAQWEGKLGYPNVFLADHCNAMLIWILMIN